MLSTGHYIVMKINLDRDEPQSSYVLCRNCNRKLFLYVTRLDRRIERPDFKDFSTGDVAVAIQIKCTKCKTYNTVTFRDEIIARPPRVDEHTVQYQGKRNVLGNNK